MKDLVCAKVFRSWGILAVLLLISLSGYSQSDVGTISGFIRDQSAAVVPAAQVSILDESTGEEHTATSDSQGHYTITNLRPAIYSMTVEAKGFKKFTSTHNKLDAS